jgi:hypothetical protein
MGRSCLLATVVTLGLIVSDVSAARYPPGDCDINDAGVPGPECILIDEWCEVTEGAVTTDDPGNVVWVKETLNCENCTEACGTEDPLPPSVSCSQEVTVSYTSSIAWNVLGGLEGTLIGSLKGKIEVERNTADGITVSVTSTIGTPELPACDWVRFYLKLKTIQGEEVHIDASVQPFRKWDCDGHTVTSSGATATGAVHASLSYAIEGSASAGTDANGRCPPEPPF